MTKLKLFVLWVFRLYGRWVLRKKKVIVVSGLRRSGNHACIAWLANAYVGERSQSQNQGKINVWNEGNFLHLNEVNWPDHFQFPILLQHAASWLKKAKVVLISIEDEMSIDGDMWTPPGSIQIYVRRRTLDLIASRITYNCKCAQQGIDKGDMMIDENMFRMQRSLISMSEQDVLLWNYDAWVQSAEWRMAFLRKLGLEVDLAPEMSRYGGGSSFVGQDKSALARLDSVTRWESVQWPKRVVDLLSENTDLLDEEELAFFRTKMHAPLGSTAGHP